MKNQKLLKEISALLKSRVREEFIAGNFEKGNGYSFARLLIERHYKYGWFKA